MYQKWCRKSSRALLCLTDYKGLLPAVWIAGTSLQGTIVDGGSDLNLMPGHTLVTLGQKTSHPVHFYVTLADHCSFPPVGIIKNVHLEIRGINFQLEFVVVHLPKFPGGFLLLIGRSWLWHAKAVHDWGSDQRWIYPHGSLLLILEGQCCGNLSHHSTLWSFHSRMLRSLPSSNN